MLNVENKWSENNEKVCLHCGEVWECQHHERCACCPCGLVGYKAGQISLIKFRELAIEYGLIENVEQ